MPPKLKKEELEGFEMADEYDLPVFGKSGGGHQKVPDESTNEKYGVWKSSKSLIQHYVYILSGQKFIKNAKNSQFWRVFWNPEACGQTVLPDEIGQKLVENGNKN